MEFSEGMIVKSTAGHDAGSFYAVVKTESGHCFIADGRRRMLGSPKKKNPRHLKRTNACLDLSEVVTDKKLRQELARFGGETGETFTVTGR